MGRLYKLCVLMGQSAPGLRLSNDFSGNSTLLEETSIKNGSENEPRTFDSANEPYA